MRGSKRWRGDASRNGNSVDSYRVRCRRVRVPMFVIATPAAPTNAVGRSPVDGKGVRTIQDGTMRPCEPSPFETDHRPTADAFSLADRRDDVVTADSRSCKGSSHATGHCMNGGG